MVIVVEPHSREPGRIIRELPTIPSGDPLCDSDIFCMQQRGQAPSASQVAAALQRHGFLGSGLVSEWVIPYLEATLQTDAFGWKLIAEAAHSAAKTMLAVHRREEAQHFYVAPFRQIASIAEAKAASLEQTK